MPSARAQDAATQQQLDKLSGQIQDIQSALNVQNKSIEELQQKVSDLQDKLNQPAGNNFASNDDLKKLADQVQQIDQKRQSDNDQILKELEKLEKGLNVTPERHSEPAATAADTTSSPASGATQKGYYYAIQPNDTIAAIAKACREQHIKVTIAQILNANPGLNPDELKVGQKIFIPQPQ